MKAEKVCKTVAWFSVLVSISILIFIHVFVHPQMILFWDRLIWNYFSLGLMIYPLSLFVFWDIYIEHEKCVHCLKGIAQIFFVWGLTLVISPLFIILIIYLYLSC